MRYKFRLSCLLATSMLGAIGGGATPVLAQPAGGSAKDATLGDIIVTARRTEERLQDVPISITVFNQQALTKANIVNSEDLARVTPSLSVNDNYGSDNALFSLRGFVQDSGTAPSVGVFFADVVAPRGLTNAIPVGDGAGPGSFFDLQNVQVLKGPQGTLFGLNTTGGDILLVPQKPTSQFGGYIEGSYGNYDMRRVQAVVNLPLNDAMRLRLGVDREINQGYLHNTSGIGPSHLGNINYTAFRGSFVVDLAPNLENYTIGSLTHSDTYGDVQKIFAGPGTCNGTPAFITVPAGSSCAFGAPNPPPAGSVIGAPVAAAQAASNPGFYDLQQNELHPQSQLDMFQIINTTTWKVRDNLTVKNIVSSAELKDDLTSELFGVNFPVTNGGATYPFQYAEVNHPAGMNTAHESTSTEELQFQGNAFDQKLTWQAGAYGEASLPVGGVSGEQTGNNGSCISAAAFLCTNPLTPVQNPTGSIINYTVGKTWAYDMALYGQATYKFTDQLKLTAGYRYTWDREDNHSTLQRWIVAQAPTYGVIDPNNPICTVGSTALGAPLILGVNTTNCNTAVHVSSNAPTWLIDLDYTPTDNILLYAKYARGYRAGVITPSIAPPLNVAQAEHINSYEGGFKTSFDAPIHMVFDAAGFFNDFSNQQIQDAFISFTGASAVSAPVNAGKSQIYGAEINASFVPFHGLVIDVNYAYLKTKITSIKALNPLAAEPGYFLAAAAATGDALVNTPENKIVVNVNYTLPLDPGLGKISLGGTFSHQDRMLANYTDLSDPNWRSYAYLGARDLLDLNASWNGIFRSPVDAAFFATNVTGLKYFTYGAGLSGVGDGFESEELGQPTMYGVRLKYHFGR